MMEAVWERGDGLIRLAPPGWREVLDREFTPSDPVWWLLAAVVAAAAFYAFRKR